MNPPNPKSGSIISNEPSAARRLITLNTSFSKYLSANFAAIIPSNIRDKVYFENRDIFN